MPIRGQSPPIGRRSLRTGSCWRAAARCSSPPPCSRSTTPATWPHTKVYSKLGFSGPRDARSDEITVQHLVEHTGGYDERKEGSDFDPTYSMRTIAERLGLSGPVTKLDIARYMYERRKLEFKPGAREQYSNYGYLLASAVVEKVTEQDYFTYLNRTILEPEEITEIAVCSTRASGRPPDQAIAEDGGLGLSPLDLGSPAHVPAVYGGDGEIKEVAAGCAGLASSAEAMVQFIHRHAVLGIGGRAPGSDRAGSTPGASAFACSRRDDGIDWALTINTREWADDEDAYKELIGDDDKRGSINRRLKLAAIP